MRDASSEQVSRCGAVYVVREGGARVAHLHHRHSSCSSSSCINMCREVRIQGGTLLNRATASLYKSASLAVTMRRLLPCLALSNVHTRFSSCRTYLLAPRCTRPQSVAHQSRAWLYFSPHHTSPHLVRIRLPPFIQRDRDIEISELAIRLPPPPHYPRRPALHPP